jgi:hypothetical protein
MGEYRIDLRDRFINTFGFIAANTVDDYFYKTGPVIASEEGNPFKIENILTPDEAVGFTKMGTPLFDRFRFIYNSADGKFEWLPDLPPMVDITRSKIVKVTDINEGDGVGEVVESWGNDAFDLTFRGLLVDMDNHRRPDDQMRQVMDFFERNDYLECESKLFNTLKIRSIYFNSKITWSFPEGYIDTVGYTINARSYDPAQLIVAL